MGILVLSCILLIIVFFWQFQPFAKQPAEPDFSRYEAELEKFRDGLKKKEEKKKSKVTRLKHELFAFDPNTISMEQWVKLGLPKWKARIINNYLDKGGRFYKKEDLKKIYGITDQEYARLKPYMNIIKEKSSLDDNDRAVKEAKANRPVPVKKPRPRRFSLNQSDSITLQKIPGIGPVYSSRIVRYREMLGGFANLAQLNEVYGIDTSLIPVLEKYAYIDSSEIRKVNLNQVKAWQLQKHPYLSRYQANAIIQYREFKGIISKVSNLRDDKVLPYPVFKKIEPYLAVSGE
jgi:DNA uptake protein ComE-like DNA-binding protein